MRKLILISALLLASATAQAGQSRSLIVASNDVPQASEKIDAVKPAETKPEAAPVEAPKETEAPKADVKPEAAAPDAVKPDATKPVKKAQVKHHESDEAKARRIAARYGISW
jgi:hypothetical protein